jgi:hypothetical protein
MKKKLIVCGCSFSAPSNDPNLAGTAYGEVLANKLGWDVEILARQGCSNGGIRVQIDEVIRQRPAFAIIAPTFHDRTEIPARAAPYDFRDDDWKGWNSELQQHLQKSHLNGYDREAGINNVNYGNNPYRMICETIFSLAENYDHPYRSSKIDKDTQKAIKSWINYLYDSEWKRQQDEWIIRDGVVQLYSAGVPFLLIANNIWTSETVRAAIPGFVPDHHMTLKYEETPAHATNNWPFKGADPGYHGDPESQKYLADTYYDIITKKFGISP